MREMPNDTTVQLVVSCDDLDGAIEFYRDALGLRLTMIRPADAPRLAVLSGRGITLRLERGREESPGRLQVVTADTALRERIGAGLTAPDGTRITAEDAARPPVVPAPQNEIVITEAGDDGRWATGRAGMQYRDLVPGRLGGAFVASHIRIPECGPVPDYVHHHHVLFQIIYCVRGRVRLVYEDQGEPFLMRTGDCVLQPPHIRHRVLECSNGFEVVEVGAPAEHDTLVDHELELPNGLDPARRFGGQAFVHLRAEAAEWQPAGYPGVEACDSGIAAATGGLVALRVLRWQQPLAPVELCADDALQFRFVLEGEMSLQAGDDGPRRLGANAAFAVPRGTATRMTVDGPGSLLEVTTSF